MRTEIQSSDLALTPGLRRYIKRRLGYALGRHGDQLQQVSLWLSDVNGPRGGQGKRCLMRIRLAGEPDVVVENIETDLRVAIHRSVDRAGWTVARCLQRQRNVKRWHSQPAATVRGREGIAAIGQP